MQNLGRTIGNDITHDLSQTLLQDSLNELTEEAMNGPLAEDPDEKDFEDLVKRMGMVEQEICTTALADHF